MASILTDSTTNYSLYTIPAAWVLSIIPHFYASKLSNSFDNRSPRTYTKVIEKDQTLDNATRDLITRAEAAQQNGFENVGLFASAIVAGNLAGLPSSTLNLLGFGYLASRVAYNLIYLGNTSVGMANVRSLVFLAGIGQIFTLFIKSGSVLSKRAANLL